MLMSPVMPEWKKVESPSTATVFLAVPMAFSKPWAIVMELPMQRQVSMADVGGREASV